jgi:hypothetical protein
MVSGGATPVGSSRVARLDPLALPIRFATQDCGADERLRQVEIDSERVVVSRAVRGMRMKVKVPIPAFLGVALKLVPADGDHPEQLEVTLAHRDGGLSIPLFIAGDSDDIIAEWQLWARVLRRPLLIANLDGTYRPPFPCLGSVRVSHPTARRRRRNIIKRRRAAFPLRRRRGRLQYASTIYREREIIARD